MQHSTTSSIKNPGSSAHYPSVLLHVFPGRLGASCHPSSHIYADQLAASAAAPMVIDRQSPPSSVHPSASSSPSTLPLR
ncbi:unnamed protein product [Tilletia controversa]|uniref:Uncharacterized protein n=1 Tax=Tilletia caries TaxID=13290 RepID=A0ABN7JFA8_9BASI|nr:unnamed protein product [Tilletia caries]CAD6983577.1 unnamed protein product [Tilletia controversa]